MEYSFKFKATGVGSLPHKNSKDACNLILNSPELIPYWPQLPKRSKLESMAVQFSEGFDFLELDQQSELKVKQEDFDKSLEKFYERVLAGSLDNFLISADYAQGLAAFFDLLKEGRFAKAEFVKGQVSGPFTFSASIKDKDNQVATFNPLLMDAIVNGLVLKASWQREQFRKFNKKTILFFDEPYLACLGSGFTPINPEEVSKRLSDLITPLKDEDTLIGIHCCANTDWGLILGIGFDIVNFDVYEFMERFLLYPQEIKTFLEKGGIIAWGLLPTLQYTPGINVDSLIDKFQYALDTLIKKGLPQELVLKNTLLTPSCGMGNMGISESEEVTKLLLKVSSCLRERYL